MYSLIFLRKQVYFLDKDLPCIHLSSWPCHQRSLVSLHWRSLFAPCNSHLNDWPLFLPLFCTWSYLLKESIPFVSFCAFVLVFTESGDKYHPYSSVRVLVSVVSSTTHTHWHDLFVLLCAKSPFLLHMFSTTFPLLLSASFYCCAWSRIAYNGAHRTTSTMSS